MAHRYLIVRPAPARGGARPPILWGRADDVADLLPGELLDADSWAAVTRYGLRNRDALARRCQAACRWRETLLEAHHSTSADDSPLWLALAASSDRLGITVELHRTHDDMLDSLERITR